MKPNLSLGLLCSGGLPDPLRLETLGTVGWRIRRSQSHYRQTLVNKIHGTKSQTSRETRKVYVFERLKAARTLELRVM
jgi:hypothetical protein